MKKRDFLFLSAGVVAGTITFFYVIVTALKKMT